MSLVTTQYLLLDGQLVTATGNALYVNGVLISGVGGSAVAGNGEIHATIPMATGSNFFRFVFPTAFAYNPEILTSLGASNSTDFYNILQTNITPTGVDIIFSDIIRETGLKLMILAKTVTGGNASLVNINYSGELNFNTGLASGASTYFIGFNPVFASIPNVQLTQKVQYSDSVYGFATSGISQSGVWITLSDVLSDSGVSFDVLAKTATGTYTTVIYINSGNLFNSSGELNFTTGLATGSDYYFVGFNPPFSSVPNVQVTEELSISGLVYPFAIQNKSVSGFNIIFADTLRDTGVLLNILAKTVTGSYQSVIQPINSFNANQITGVFNVVSGSFRYAWTGSAIGTGILPSAIGAYSGIEVYFKNKSRNSTLVVSGNIDNSQNYSLAALNSLTVWSDGQTWNIV